MNLPELPPRFRWNPEAPRKEVEIEAYSTAWAGKGAWEGIAYIAPSGGALRANVWKVNQDGYGNWEEIGGPLSCMEEAVQYLWSLVQLGEADFTFLEEPCEPTTRD